ncbi:heterokaryon incompatibility protein [Paramyrothecium foliicola]|nr:heterokaryon incompatibility protein [Paramyrothecium foliicola]
MFNSDSTTKIMLMERDKKTKEFLPMTEKPFPGGAHHSDPGECAAAAQAGCPICVLVWRHILGDQDQLRGQCGRFTTYMAQKGSVAGSQAKYDEDLWILQISFKGWTNKREAVGYAPSPDDSLSFALMPKSNVPTSMLGSTQDTSTRSQESWDFMEKSLKNCLENHPNRDGLDTVKLCERHDISKDSEYIALSHCWGQHPMLTLTDPSLSSETESSISVEDLKSGIQTTGLPATFRHAVAVTRNLGISYLWIDALCIIQNSVKDWATEALTMHEVYSSAICTLAATFSYDGNGGLFKHRNPASVNPVCVQPVWADDPDVELLVRPLDYWRIHITDAPLNQRGWVVQERVLSRRIIHFGMNQILWECDTIDCCEGFPAGLPTIAGDRNTRFKGLELETDGFDLMNNALKKLEIRETSSAQAPAEASKEKKPHAIQEGHETGLEGYYLWSQVLEKYTVTRLTKGSDKLVAISGLVKHFQTFLKDEFVSGLWRSILPSQLLWKVEDGAEVSTFVHPDLAEARWEEYKTNARGTVNASRSEVWRAPTWSWASIDGQIAAPPPSRDPGVVSISAILIAEAGREFGEVPVELRSNTTANSLLIHGSLHFGNLIFNPQIMRWCVAVHPVGICRDRPPGEFSKAELITDEIDLSSMHHPDGLIMAVAYPDTDLPIGESHFVFCMPILKTARRKALRSDNMTEKDANFAGLMLRLVPNVDSEEETPMFTRVGCFHVLKNENLGEKMTTAERYAELFAVKGHILLI